MKFPRIQGTIHTDERTRRRYSTDMGRYFVLPLAVAVPADEKDVADIVEFSRDSNLPLTPRGSGSNLSGSAVGEGLLLLFTDMRSITQEENALVRAGPGTVYDTLNAAVSESGLSLRYDVSSGGFSTVGGNLATRAGGLRSIKYGTVDDALVSVRFVDTIHGVVDTSRGIPGELELGIRALKARILNDEKAVQELERRRGLKSSSGYNLRALIDHQEPAAIAAHLMAGSVGTLGVFTDIRMKLVPTPEQRLLCAAFFHDVTDAVDAVQRIVDLGPSACEALDALGTRMIGESIELPPDAGCVLLVELDDGLPRSRKPLEEILEAFALSRTFISDSRHAERVWGIRWSMLTRIRRMNEDRDHRYISFVDDMAVPLPHLKQFIVEIRKIFREEGVSAVMYGHIGEGNLHIRPLIEREGWRDRVLRIAERCFDVLMSHGGTLTAEHGEGRNRAAFLRREWSERMYAYFREVKKLFDPSGLLNPGVMFSDSDFTEGFRF
jgi:glycolate oxidase